MPLVIGMTSVIRRIHRSLAYHCQPCISQETRSSDFIPLCRDLLDVFNSKSENSIKKAGDYLRQ